ncbi:SubName: Full=Uncharacterized protein {ECO:0000313/EMBL:CCA76330.1} [Serendipita indica DSM 11827]|nr:SubName: Full=Uncharacterized protein {ECO:0000313/EMBL:CCA76330.1} [Serendipita indica DSM 11827]
MSGCTYKLRSILLRTNDPPRKLTTFISLPIDYGYLAFRATNSPKSEPSNNTSLLKKSPHQSSLCLQVAKPPMSSPNTGDNNASPVAQATSATTLQTPIQAGAPPVIDVSTAKVVTPNAMQVHSQEPVINVVTVLTQSTHPPGTDHRPPAPCQTHSEASSVVHEFFEPQWSVQSG